MKPCRQWGRKKPQIGQDFNVLAEILCRILYLCGDEPNDDGVPIEREKDLHVLYRLVWFGTPSDFGAEANDGRGPVDFKISRGTEKTLVEMKLAKNTKLARNLEKQVEIYQKASDAKTGIKAIIYFTAAELAKVRGILKDLKLTDNPDVVLIDARRDNKPSASKAA